MTNERAQRIQQALAKVVRWRVNPDATPEYMSEAFSVKDVEAVVETLLDTQEALMRRIDLYDEQVVALQVMILAFHEATAGED